MVHFCCVPGCSSKSFRESYMSFFGLPLKDKKLLKQWIHAIGRKNLYLNKHTRVCSRHFVNANKRLLRPDEVATLELPQFSTPSSHRAPPKECSTSVPVDMPLQHSESPTELEYQFPKMYRCKLKSMVANSIVSPMKCLSWSAQ